MHSFKVVIIGNGEYLDPDEYLKDDQQVGLVQRVADIAPFYNDCLLNIVTLQSATSILLKITKAMSFGCPVISTTLGAEYIGCDKNPIVIAD